MKTGAKTLLKPTFKLLFLSVIFFGSTQIVLAQDNGQDNEAQEVDSVKTGASLGRLKLENPQSIVSKYTYDPILDRYIYSESIGNYDISYPIILTPAQYMEMVRKEGMKDYFQEKIDA